MIDKLYRQATARLIEHLSGRTAGGDEPLCRELTDLLTRWLPAGALQEVKTEPDFHRSLIYDSLLAMAEVNPRVRELIRGLSRAAEPASANPSSRPAAAPGGSRSVRILFLGANPLGTTPLRLDQEMRDIEQALNGAPFRERFDLRQQWAVRVRDLQAYLLRHQPQILHFSGHGSSTHAIFLEDDTGQCQAIPGLTLAKLLALFRSELRCVVLNACYSEGQAQAIADSIDCVIGMSTAIGDAAAIRFSASFYQALASGTNLKKAFDLGCLQIDLEQLGEENTPQLLDPRSQAAGLVFC